MNRGPLRSRADRLGLKVTAGPPVDRLETSCHCHPPALDIHVTGKGIVHYVLGPVRHRERCSMRAGARVPGHD